MKREIRIQASAKINIGLDIGNPRPDGYHPVLGIFHSVGISDKIRFSRTEGMDIAVEGVFDCPVEDTTLYKAAELFLRRQGIHHGFKATVEKRIPAMAGLGGGSVDAAATLIALDSLYATNLSYGELSALAGEIGSDVPFFLKGGAAIVSGTGDVIEPIPPRTDFGILLLYPGFGVSTRWAYAELDSLRRTRKSPSPGEDEMASPATAKGQLVAAFGRAPAEWHFTNSFREMLYSAFPVYHYLETQFREAGAAYVSITGSGSCMYGIYDSIGEACGAEEKLMAAFRYRDGEKTIYGMALHAIKPLETSLLLG